ncbi:MULTISPECIES: hypothetical protein [unclassified Streptomyces]|uniref:hypothetical protein n=1 Tax=unclassified Streptomyces TaxID=2593676 RepID=UPI00278BF6D3|nr:MULTISPECIES: hypothetical protein [unclassified Streptomyces]
MNDLELLAAYRAYGTTEPVHNDWRTAEEALKVSIPTSIKAFFDAFGGASFDDFLHVYRAGASNPHLDLVTQTLQARDTMRKTRPHIQHLLEERGSSPDQLIRWAGTDNADLCFLVPQPAPQDWAVLTVVGRGPEYDLYDGPVEGYLLRVMRGELLSDVFPEDFPDEEPGYVPNPTA